MMNSDNTVIRSLYLRILSRELRQAIAAAERAAARRDFRTQRRMLTSALKLSKRIAELNGVDVKGLRQNPDIGAESEAERIAREVIEAVANRRHED